jgi:hypothetical protein
MKPLHGILLATIFAVAAHSIASQAATVYQDQETMDTTTTQTTDTTTTNTTTNGAGGGGGTSKEPSIRFSNAVRFYQPTDIVPISFGANTVWVEEYLNYTGYSVGESLRVALTYGGTCPVRFKSLTDTGIFTFRPRRVTGAISDADASNIGTVLFFVRFDTLTRGGSRSYGTATLQLDLDVDHDCDQNTPNIPLNVGISVIVSTKNFH